MMNNYTIGEFVMGYFAVNCESQEETKAFLTRLEEEEVQWCTGDDINPEKDVEGFEAYADRVCFLMEDGLCYSSLDSCVRDGDTVWKYKDLVEKEVLPEVPEEAMVPAEQCTDIPEIEPTVGLSELFKNPDKLYKYKDNYYKYDLDDDAILTSGTKDGLFINTALTFKALNELEFQEFIEREYTLAEIIAMETQPRVRLNHELFEEALDTPFGCRSREEITVQYYKRYMDGGYLYINNIMSLISWFCGAGDVAQIFKEGKFIIEENE